MTKRDIASFIWILPLLIVFPLITILDASKMGDGYKTIILFGSLFLMLPLGRTYIDYTYGGWEMVKKHRFGFKSPS